MDMNEKQRNKIFTGRLPSISRSCSVVFALAITLWLVEFLRHHAIASWLSVHCNFSAIFVNNLILF